MPESRIRRRQLLAFGAAGVGGVAGCFEGDERTKTARITDDRQDGGDDTSTERETETPTRQSFDSFVDVDGTEFTLDGDAFYYCGGHSGNVILFPAASDPATEYAYEDAFDGDHYVEDFMRFSAAHGMNVVRIVLSSSTSLGGNVIHRGPGEFNEEWFSHFDTVVAAARRNGVRLVVSPLPHDRHLAPGPMEYARWADSVDDDLDGRALYDAFFRNEEATGYYKSFLERLLTHESSITGLELRDDPTIMMWECGNEIEWARPEKSGESLAEWYDDVARYIKSLDDNHIVGSGMYGSPERNDFLADHRSDAIDACSFHLYPKMGNGKDLEEPPYDDDPWRDRSLEETKGYISGKVEQAHDELGKPVYLGEYGVPQFPDIYGWDLATRIRFLAAAFEAAAEHDLNGVNVFALELILKPDAGVATTDGRESNGVYPDDEETLAVIEEYARTAEEKSGTPGS